MYVCWTPSSYKCLCLKAQVQYSDADVATFKLNVMEYDQKEAIVVHEGL